MSGYAVEDYAIGAPSTRSPSHDEEMGHSYPSPPRIGTADFAAAATPIAGTRRTLIDQHSPHSYSSTPPPAPAENPSFRDVWQTDDDDEEEEYGTTPVDDEVILVEASLSRAPSMSSTVGDMLSLTSISSGRMSTTIVDLDQSVEGLTVQTPPLGDAGVSVFDFDDSTLPTITTIHQSSDRSLSINMDSFKRGEDTQERRKQLEMLGYEKSYYHEPPLVPAVIVKDENTTSNLDDEYRQPNNYRERRKEKKRRYLLGGISCERWLLAILLFFIAIVIGLMMALLLTGELGPRGSSGNSPSEGNQNGIDNNGEDPTIPRVQNTSIELVPLYVELFTTATSDEVETNGLLLEAAEEHLTAIMNPNVLYFENIDLSITIEGKLSRFNRMHNTNRQLVDGRQSVTARLAGTLNLVDSATSAPVASQLELLNKVAFSGARIEEFLAFVRFSGLDTTSISVTDQNGDQIGFASVEPITTSPSNSPTRQGYTKPPVTSPPSPAPIRNPTLKPSTTERETSPQPMLQPTASPTKNPTRNPTESPEENSTSSPTDNPTRRPTLSPTNPPVLAPTREPTSNPTPRPTNPPTRAPTREPTTKPTSDPTNPPTRPITQLPTYSPGNHVWKQVGSTIIGQEEEARLGNPVSLSSDGKRMAVGGKLHGTGSSPDNGIVRVFEEKNNKWEPMGQDIFGENALDWMGYSVSLSGNGRRLAVGASGYHDGTGLVKIYEFNGFWNQLGGDLIGDSQSDFFGCWVSISRDGTTVAVGAYQKAEGSFEESKGRLRGYVRVYSFVKGTWLKKGNRIRGESPGDISGRSLSLSDDGSILAVGAQHNSGNGEESGHARIFRFDNDNDDWVQMGQDLDGEDEGDHFGRAVSLSGDGGVIAVGAHLNDGNGNDSGHVRVFKYNTDIKLWLQIGDDIDGEQRLDQFGWQVTLSADGHTLGVGAWSSERNNREEIGHVSIFRVNGGSWQKLGDDIVGEEEGDESGRSVSLSANGERIAIGATRSNNSRGSVRILDVQASP
uniref:Uncharacterized protein n=1 Tax=Attheya septentrionalis TaxID=420275 RepID=A0A7S2UMU5_9STRA|mmetsp:Transcript_5145/g.9038  ORF Transcript_5145/g.9038 Transcript_5145/m.9038 type:complete len:1013 (+) Transcript_5145:197-3235(+)